MSLITRCPDCGTMFKVVSDQLRISDGWVRCGHCSGIFDAAVHLQPEPAAEDLPTRDAESHDLQQPDPLEAAGIHPNVTEAVSDDPEPDAKSHAKGEAGSDEGAVDAGGDGDHEEPEPAKAGPEKADLAQAHEISADSGDIGFVRQARRRQLWQSPAVRAILWVISLALILLLATQVTVHERDRLAAMDPRLKAPLDAMCVYVGCAVSPLRQIESIVIDGSSFNKLRNGDYKLSLLLRNSGAVQVAVPALELALTDTRDQTVLRKILTLAELGFASSVLGPGEEWNAAVVIRVSGAAVNGEAVRVAGYRVLAFYP
ncbi:MAG: DUF3426 domain-containing protein [Ramlibacter sp.]|nr:DUF3426 domain-containing protein [Ramlibacter sp.]